MSADCIFCEIIAGKIPSTTVYKDNTVTAIRDINPQAPTHILVMPNRHVPSVSAAADSDQALLGALLWSAKRVAQQEGLSEFRLVINNGRQAGQTVFHLHVHLLGGRSMHWPPG